MGKGVDGRRQRETPPGTWECPDVLSSNHPAQSWTCTPHLPLRDGAPVMRLPSCTKGISSHRLAPWTCDVEKRNVCLCLWIERGRSEEWLFPAPQRWDTIVVAPPAAASSCGYPCRPIFTTTTSILHASLCKTYKTSSIHHQLCLSSALPSQFSLFSPAPSPTTSPQNSQVAVHSATQACLWHRTSLGISNSARLTSLHRQAVLHHCKSCSVHLNSVCVFWFIFGDELGNALGSGNFEWDDGDLFDDLMIGWVR